MGNYRAILPFLSNTCESWSLALSERQGESRYPGSSRKSVWT